MENEFYDNDFEKFLKQEAENYRMYPSDHIWRNIQQEVHGYQKWPALGIISIFVISALLIGTVLVKPHSQTALVASTSMGTTVENNKRGVSDNQTTSGEKKYLNHISSGNINNEIAETGIAKNKNLILSDAVLVSNETVSNEINDNLNQPANIAEAYENQATFTTAVAVEKTPVNKTGNSGKGNNVISVNPDITKQDITQAANIQAEKNSGTKIPFSSNTLEADLIAASLIKNSSFHQKIDFSKKHFDLSYLFTNMFEFTETKNPQTQLNFGSYVKNNSTTSPLSKFSGKKSKFDFQVYVTPSISYRRLIDDYNGELSRSYITALPFAANYVVDINNIVKHTPAAGYEFGFLLGYNLNSKLAIRSGFQFNMRQYNINAFVHNFEPAAASLLTGVIVEPNSITGFRNISGSEPIVLKNRYYEVSLPIAIDWRPINKRLAWGMSASIQPDYTFDKEPFIVTTNYKNYKDGSQLIRNWNINASFETYIGYNTGKYRWQLGPQIRTQLLPSLSSSYPIREYPIDYGIKLSLIRALK